MVSCILICLFTFGLIKVLLPNVCAGIQWSCVLHGFRVEFETHLEMVAVFCLGICLWWVSHRKLTILKPNMLYRLLIPQILQAAHLLRLRDLLTSSEIYTRKFWRLYSNRWDTTHMAVLPIAVWVELVKSSIQASWSSHRMLRRQPTFAGAALLEPLTHALSVLYRTQSCMKFLQTSRCTLQPTCKRRSGKLQAPRRKVKSSAF